MKFYVILVIYNKSLKESCAYEQLKKKDIRLIVCDNSTEENVNAMTAERDCVTYISMEGNQGLSKAYNRAIDYIWETFRPQNEDFICFFDDDTVIPAEYFYKIKKQRGKILLPVVRDLNGIMSPVILKDGIAKRFQSKEKALKTESEILSGINSGMAVRMEIYKNYRYNEQMFLDYIDHMFIMDMRKQKIYPQVFDMEIEQHFSAAEDDKETARKRFAMQKKDLRIFYGSDSKKYWYVVIKKHIKLAIKYKDLTMLFH